MEKRSRSKNRKYTKELLEENIESCFSISDVCRKVGAKTGGGSYELIKSRLKEYNIDCSHFLGQKAFSGKRNPNYNRRTHKDNILIDNHLKRVPHKKLKRALIESNIEYKCNVCGINSWNDKDITLDVDHINGDSLDCRLDNLRFLCPNCHRQTDTFAGKNIRG